jgi:hypothetical protein
MVSARATKGKVIAEAEADELPLERPVSPLSAFARDADRNVHPPV